MNKKTRTDEWRPRMGEYSLSNWNRGYGLWKTGNETLMISPGTKS